MQDFQIINKIKINGYSPGGSMILEESKRKELEQIVDKLFLDQSVKKDYSSNAPVLLYLVGIDARLDFLLEEILNHSSVRNVTKDIIGEDYKIWEISARYSLPGDCGLGLHQDAWGQVNLAFAINDQQNIEGTTSFFRGTHLLPRWAKYISWARPDIANLFTSPLTLAGSDYAFFINKTWHSRRKNRGTEIKKVLLFGFYPNGARYRPLYKDYIRKINPSCQELIRGLNVEEGVRNIDSGWVQVVSRRNPNSIPYSAWIENNLVLNWRTTFVYLKLFLIEIIFRPLQIFFRIYKFIFKR
ncbi:putative 2OG-Fe(II) oxygenase [Leptospira santarosai]|uniref:putative 2OG-Fe(II) oxygenase n=1 Tax=Leptospira santarosai TaxID=28183 RepID=UPI000773748C|nr:putative 2OG-Fe(II) oxygenase [Leptospira santarosai]MDI7189568.1 putative 2OG-Fe(II) oxygenase [Leptospira santarosai]MDI7211308.1 putative 2OG-Fe(II) oxygenase [Leptospira santarosai]MDI7221743.1 putative 2OG-Fe(II) oxygenase [Leptospira santarosai]